MKLTRFADDYQRAVLQFAQSIVTMAERTRIPPGPVMDYDSMPTAWDEGALEEMAGEWCSGTPCGTRRGSTLSAPRRTQSARR